MKVALVSAEYPPMQGGVGDYSSWLAAALSRQGLEVSVVTSARVGSDGRDDDCPWNESVISVVPRWDFGSWKHVLQAIDATRPEVVHIQYQTAGYGMHPAINLLPLRLRLLRHRPKCVVTFHDLKVPYLFPKAGSLRAVPAALLARFSDAVVVTNVEDSVQIANAGVRRREGTRTRYGGRPLYTIPIGTNIPVKPPADYDRQIWRERLGIENKEILLAYFGFLNASKGVDVLLAALVELVGKGHSLKLLMIGGSYGDSDPTNLAYGQRIRAGVEESTCRHRVLWSGFTDRAHVSANLLASDVCVLPFDEGASLRHGSLVAAIVHGLPIITTRAVAGRASLASSSERDLPTLEGRTVLVPPRDVAALVDAVEQLSGSASLRQTLSRRVSEIAPVFDWEAIAQETAKVYRDVL